MGCIASDENKANKEAEIVFEKPYLTEKLDKPNIQLNLGQAHTKTIKTKTVNRKMNEMEEYIKTQLQKKPLTREICEYFGLTKFVASNYISLEILGKGSYGEVSKAKDNSLKVLVAVKKANIKNIMKDNENQKLSNDEKYDMMIDNVASFMIEKSVLEKLKKIKNYPDYFPEYYGSFYEDDENGEIMNLILVTEAGDYNLDELLSVRRKYKSNSAPYTVEEVIGFLAFIIDGYYQLQEFRIYHSDIKLKNIVYSERKKKFMIIDFGGAKQIPENESELKIDEYAITGTVQFNSPEKREFWDFSADEKNKDKDFENCFNPFKCDIYSLGICLNLMLGMDVSENDLKKTRLYEILQKMLEKNWKERADSINIVEYLKKYEIKAPENFESTEKQYTEICQRIRFRKERYILLYEKYKKAGDSQKMFDIALQEYKEVVEKDYLYCSKVLKCMGEAYQLIKRHDYSKWYLCSELYIKLNELLLPLKSKKYIQPEIPTNKEKDELIDIKGKSKSFEILYENYKKLSKHYMMVIIVEDEFSNNRLDLKGFDVVLTRLYEADILVNPSNDNENNIYYKARGLIQKINELQKAPSTEYTEDYLRRREINKIKIAMRTQNKLT